MTEILDIELRKTYWSEDFETPTQSSPSTSEVEINDPSYASLWGISKIQAPEVWDKITSSEPIVVAVLDTGVDYTHPDLKNNIWTNPGEIADDDIDNDGNGYIDDVYGWDFRNHDEDPTDDHSHGTHVAGTIAAEWNNSIGVVGVDPFAEILALKFLSGSGSGSSTDAATAIEYAVELKKAYDEDPKTGANVRVINASFGGGSYNASLDLAIQEAAKFGILVVAAAGNNSGDNDTSAFYPANYPSSYLHYYTDDPIRDNVISVASSNSGDGKSGFSNYGATTVDVAAPGHGIYSTIPSNRYGNKSGTSMAAPHVAGAASLLFAYDPALTPEEAKQILIQSVDYSSSFENKTVSEGRINLDKAFSLLINGTVNQVPLATNDTYTLNEDTTQTGNVLDNDSDPDSDTLTVNLDGNVTNGDLSLNSDGTFSYTPASNFNGTDSFSYQISDGNGGIATAIVTLTINPVNDVPVPQTDSYTLNEDGVLSVSSTNGVLDNDSDVDGNSLTATLDSNVTQGSLTLDSNGSFTYTPNDNINGTDSFTYQVSDGNGGTATATVTLTIDPVNDAPVAEDDSYTLEENSSLSISVAQGVLSNDSDIEGNSLTATLVDNVTQGNLTLNEDGSFDYTPNANVNGTDSFTYQVSDGNGGTARATVTLSINSVNDAPVAQNDSYILNEDGSLSVSSTDGVLDNDSDVDGNSLTATLVDNVTQGSLTLNEDGSFDYTPNANVNGTDSFTYQVSDGNGGTATATVTLTINPVNDAPVAEDDSYTLEENSSLTVSAANSVLSNDSDIEGNHLTATLVDNVTQGSLILDDDGSFDYTPNANVNGTDSFTYQVSDGNGGTATATVTLTINPVNDLPDTQIFDFAIIVNGVPVSYSEVQSYAGSQDRTGTVTFPDTDTINLTGNNWKAVALTDGYTITSNTVLTFEFQSLQQGEMQGIGLDSDLNLNSGGDNIINLYGIETFSTITDFRYDEEVGGWQSFSVNLGNDSVYQNQTVNHLFFVNDDDGHSAGDSRFRNIQLSEQGSPNQPPSADNFAITVNGEAVSYSEVQSYAGSQDRTGTVTFPDTDTINLTGNNWKAVALETSYTITSNTVLTFEFQSLQQGEMQGIGLDSDLNLNSGGDNIINLYGTEHFETITDFRYDEEVGGWQSFSINLGNYSVYQDQEVTNLFFVNDDDGHSAGNSWFRNIKLSSPATDMTEADILTGTSGADTFRFDDLLGVDTVTNFNASEGDKIEIDTSIYGLETGDFTKVSLSDSNSFLSYNGYDLAILEGVTNANFSVNNDVLFI